MSFSGWFRPKPELVAAPAPSPEPVLPYCCPHCGSPHTVEVAPVRHLYPSAGDEPKCVARGSANACALCGTLFVVTNRGVEERKQRQPEQQQPQPSPGNPPPADLNSRVKELKWRRPKV